MPLLRFTPHLRQHLAVCDGPREGTTVAEVIASACAELPRLRGYLLDDQNRLRVHVTIFVNGQTIRDRQRLTDAVHPSDEVFVFQALSGG